MTRTYTYFFDRELLDELDELISRIQLKFAERRPFVGQDLADQADDRLSILRAASRIARDAAD